MFRLYIALPCTLLFFATFVPASAEQLGKSQFANTLHKFTVAETRRDYVAWAKLITTTSTPDSLFYDSMGNTYNVKQSVDSAKPMMAAETKVLVDSYVIKSFTAKKNTATAVVAQNMKYQTVDSSGQMGPKGKIHTVALSDTMTFHLVASKSGWLSKTVYATNIKMTQDGKPFSDVPTPNKPPKKS